MTNMSIFNGIFPLRKFGGGDFCIYTSPNLIILANITGDKSSYRPNHYVHIPITYLSTN